MNDVKLEDILKAVKEEFGAELQAKTGWGRNEAQSALDRAINAALLRFIKI